MAHRRERDPEYSRRKSLEYYHRNSKKCLAKAKEWRMANKEVHRECRLKSRERNPVGSILECIRYRAKRQGVAFNLTEDWWLAHFSQGCDVTGLDLDAPIIGSGVRRSGGPWSAHVDRIKAGGPYTMDNCRIVCGLYNKARCNWSDADVLRMAEALVANKKAQ